ncbi:MAG: CDP-diacylglycerol--glycerol-3-phosphate 3-phosphatidyltransferase [Chlamydiae bacterium]|nr:CDP-diacylglycerol--glycerol-3-phosphate 3-phosphatidyltransferase [Chlamydiota bacterium]
MTIANTLTFIRIILSPLFLVFYLWHGHVGISFIALPYILLGILTFSELTDAFDGYFARKYHQVSDFGKIVDPMADSISRISCLLAFTQGAIALPLLLVFIFLYRDLMISTLRTICALKGIALAARPSGKIKAIIQAVAIYIVVLLLIPFSLGYLKVEDLRLISIYIISLAALYTVYSAFDYFYAHHSAVKKMIQNKDK